MRLLRVALDEREPDWSGWVSAAETYRWCDKDPFMDWMNANGTKAGFVADSRRPGYDRRFDYLSFALKRSWAFRQAVMRLLSRQWEVRTIATNPSQTRHVTKMQQTIDAMKEGVPIIAQAVLWNRDDRMTAVVDLLIRSDVLKSLCPAAFAGEPPGAPAVSAPLLGDVPYHYRAIDIKFVTLHLLKDGSASLEHLPYLVQNWIYNEALGKTQGYTPPASYLLGRDLFGALARVRHDPELGRHAAEAAAWIRRLRTDGASWHLLPAPSVDELRPNLKAPRDREWHTAKHEIGQTQHDLTLLPYVGPERRALAAASGISRWDDPALSASTVGLGDSTEGRRLDAVLTANRSTGDPSVFPARLVANVGNWQRPAPHECFVSLHRVNDQADDFSRLPERNGAAMLFMITWGWQDHDGRWQSRQLVVRELSLAAEAEMISAWQAEVERWAETNGLQLRDVRLFHWGNLDVPVPDLNWFDLLENVIHKEPVTVRGAFGFGLSEIAGALHSIGLIDTALPERPGGALEAMAGAWSSAEEAASLQIPLEQAGPMQIIGRFSHATCRSMMEILGLLRQRADTSLEEAA